MRPCRLVPLLWLLMIAGLAWAADARAQNAPPLLTACDRTATVTPEAVLLACSDGRLQAEGLQWSGWGDAVAEGRGRARANECSAR